MTQLNVRDAAPGERGGYKVDVNRGERIGRVSSEWFSRPADERYLSLSDLHAAVRGRAERSRTRTAESAVIRVDATRDDAERLALILPGEEVPLMPTHWSFGQLRTMIGAPSTYLRQLPAPLAAINLQYGLTSHRAELIKTLEVEDGRVELRAVTGPDYGRIYDHELVAGCGGSPVTAPVIRAGRCLGCSTGRRACTTRESTSGKTRRRCTLRIVMYSCS